MPKAPRPPERYRLRFRRLRRLARALVLENGALCDEVARLEAKWLRARHERRFLLGHLLRLRAGPDEPQDGPDEPPKRPRRAKDGARAAAGRARAGRDGQRPEGKDGSRAAAVKEDAWSSGQRAAGARPNGVRPAEEARPPREEHGLVATRAPEEAAGAAAAVLRPAQRRRPSGRGEDEEEEEEEDNEEEEEEEEEDEEEEEEEEEEEGAAPAFGYADLFLGSPAGSDE